MAETHVAQKKEIRSDNEIVSAMPVAIDFITEQTLRDLSSDDRCSLVLDRLLQSRVIVFEGGLPPQEQTKLIKRTMERIDHETFWGIDILTHECRKKSGGKLFRREQDIRYTVIRPVHVKVEFMAW